MVQDRNRRHAALVRPLLPLPLVRPLLPLPRAAAAAPLAADSDDEWLYAADGDDDEADADEDEDPLDPQRFLEYLEDPLTIMELIIVSQLAATIHTLIDHPRGKGHYGPCPEGRSRDARGFADDLPDGAPG